jgi:hypothetical protein
MEWNGTAGIAIVHISCCLQFTDDMYTVIMLNNVHTFPGCCEKAGGMAVV